MPFTLLVLVAFHPQATPHNLHTFDFAGGISVCSTNGSCGHAGNLNEFVCAQSVQGEDVVSISSRCARRLYVRPTVGACAVIDRSDPRHDTINRAAANARNESILLNIIRASPQPPAQFCCFFAGVWIPERASQCRAPRLRARAGSACHKRAKADRVWVFVFNANTNVNNSFDISILGVQGILTAVC